MRLSTKTVICSFLILFFADSIWAQSSISSREDREALFDYIIEKTLDREAFSPVKEKTLGVDVRKEMMKYKEEVINADSDLELYYALQKLSSARKDRHLSINLVENGLELPEIEKGMAPILFHPSFGKDGNYFMFVVDYSKAIGNYTDGMKPSLGDKLVAVNGKDFNSYFEEAKPYLRYSTINNLWKQFAHSISEKDDLLPPSFYGNKLELTLERKGGTTYTLSLPYLDEEVIEWEGYHTVTYSGYELAYKKQNYHLYLPTDNNNRTILIRWLDFEEELPSDVNYLVDFAEQNNLLEHDIIIDATLSSGGSRGAYALQRMSPKPFKTTFGNLKISDIVPDFIDRMTNSYLHGRIEDDGVKETDDDGSWVMDWLHNDVIKGMARGQSYTNNVPFKSAHLPKYSDGIMQPASKHLKGEMVAFFGPEGGSHLDQFAAMIIDNNLGYTLGMPAGGYSNTWEWEEVLRFPISGKPVVEFMWSIGHTIRPNMEILEGNPAKVDEYIPVTRENYEEYYDLLIGKARNYFRNSETK